MFKRVTIKRFKNLSDIDIELDRMNVFVGSNNAGKSSILQAIQFSISAAQTTTLENARWGGNILSTSIAPAQLVYAPLRDVYALAPEGKLKENSSDAITVEMEHMDQMHSSKVLVGKGRNKNLTVRLYGKYLGEKLQDIENPYSIYVPGLAGIPAVEEYKTPGIVRKAAARGDANNVFRNILWLLKQDPNKWGLFLENLNEIFPDIEVNVDFDPNRDEHINATSIYNGSKLPIDSLGTGVLQAMQILSYVNLYNPQILILDEPDSHLHPNNQRKLAKILLDLTRNQDLQVLLSTHSRHIIDELISESEMHWVQNGEIATEDYDILNVLVDIGALDKGEKLLNNQIKYVLLTEDANSNGIETLLVSSGFDLAEVDVWSYNGCTKIDTALVLREFIRKHAPSATVILHRDRDYLQESELEEFKRTVGVNDISCFITEGTDVESHYLVAEHINYLYPSVSVEEANTILNEATQEVESKTIEKFINSRCDIESKDVGRNRINAGKISSYAREEYLKDVKRYRHGKIVLKRVKAKLQQRVSGRRIDLLVSSPYIAVPELNALKI